MEPLLPVSLLNRDSSAPFGLEYHFSFDFKETFFLNQTGGRFQIQVNKCSAERMKTGVKVQLPTCTQRYFQTVSVLNFLSM